MERDRTYEAERAAPVNRGLRTGVRVVQHNELNLSYYLIAGATLTRSQITDKSGNEASVWHRKIDI